MNVNKQVLIIGFVWPEPNSSAAGSRMLQLIDLFIESGYSVIFASAAMASDFMFDLSEIGVEKKTIALNCNSFDVFIKELNPSIVLYDRFNMEEQYGWRVANSCPDALTILDTEDLHCLRLCRQKAFKKGNFFKIEDLLIEDITKREIASILRCDVTLLISEFEKELLESFFKIDKELLYYLPFFIASLNDDEFSQLKKFEERQNFMFIGNFLHEPNWNAVLYLKETIWPLIRKKMPSAILKIYGAYPSQKVFQLENKNEGFLIMGRADNAQEVIEEAKILLAPLRFGAGIKGKLVEAMQFGTPSVTTSIGSESINSDFEWNGFISDNENEFAEKTVTLYHSKDLWIKSQVNGRIILKNRFDKSRYAPSFMAFILELQQKLNEHRRNNFLGALLKHHTMKSTEYMSKWIQEKNKL